MLSKKIILIMVLSLFAFSFSATLSSNKDTQVMDEQKMLIDSLKKFVDDKPEAADEMEYVIQKKEDNARKKMNDMLEQMAKDTTDNVKADDELSGGTLDYLARKLNLALVYFYEAKYWLTIAECNNVVKVDPKNATAWIRRGSAYYMLEQYEQAKKDWQLALTLNPKKRDRADLVKYVAKLDSLIAQNNE